MSKKEILISEIEQVPESYLDEVVDKASEIIRGETY